MDNAKLLQKIIDLIPQPIFWKDADLIYLGCNQHFATLAGYDSPADIVGKSDFELSRSEEAEAFRAADRSVMTSGQAILECEEVHHQRNGKRATLMTSKVPLTDDDGELLGVLGTYADVSALKLIEEELRTHRNELARMHSELVEEIDRAVVVQQQMLPAEAPACGFLQIDVFRQPFERITGDFYTFRHVRGGSYSFLGADIVGHGVSAALFTSLLKFTCQRASNDMRERPAEFLCFLDHELRGEIPHGMFTASAYSFRRHWKGHVEFNYACAAHPPPIHFAAATGQWSYLEKGAVAVGLLREVERHQHTLALTPGDRIFFYTDGFTEAATPGGQELGDEAFLQLFAGTEAEALKATRERLLEGLARTGHAVRDDLTLIGFQILRG